mmetsp:Transcript_26952/g.58894  ORF Transcript_26952/g.58894 Transcript_26952/m.58894 type:complete len:200 (+) Transcript_26952:2363-2962(+)
MLTLLHYDAACFTCCCAVPQQDQVQQGQAQLALSLMQAPAAADAAEPFQALALWHTTSSIPPDAAAATTAMGAAAAIAFIAATAAQGLPLKAGAGSADSASPATATATAADTCAGADCAATAAVADPAHNAAAACLHAKPAEAGPEAACLPMPLCCLLPRLLPSSSSIEVLLKPGCHRSTSRHAAVTGDAASIWQHIPV